jgi:hypothetical protein
VYLGTEPEKAVSISEYISSCDEVIIALYRNEKLRKAVETVQGDSEKSFTKILITAENLGKKHISEVYFFTLLI